MADTLKLRIPDEHLQPLREFAALTRNATEKLMAVLMAEPPIASRDELEKKLTEQVPQLRERKGLLNALIAIDVLRTSHDWRVDDVAQTIAAAEQLKLAPARRKAFE